MLAAALAASCLASFASLAPLSAQAAAQSEASLRVTAAADAARAGEDVAYTFSVSCSGQEAGCIAPVLTAVVPAGLDLASPPVPAADESVAYDRATGSLTVAYTVALPAPPNPPGSVGLPAGAVRESRVGLRLLQRGDGDQRVVTVRATVAGENTSIAAAEAAVTVAGGCTSPDDPVGAGSGAPGVEGATCVAQDGSPDGGSLGSAQDPGGEAALAAETTVGSVYVSKQVTGPGARFLPTQPPFPASYTVTITCEQPTEDGFEPLFVRSNLLLAGERRLVGNDVPIGSRCWGEEVDTYGATTSTVVPGSMEDALILTAEQPEITVAATNDYQVGRIEVSKVVEGMSSTESFDIHLGCFWQPTGVILGSAQPEGIPVELPDDGALQLRAGQTVAFDVPVPSTCSVYETGAPDQFTATYEVTNGTPGENEGQVLVAAPGQTGSVRVVNTYSPDSQPTMPAAGAGAAARVLPLSLLTIAVGGLLMLAGRRLGTRNE